MRLEGLGASAFEHTPEPEYARVKQADRISSTVSRRIGRWPKPSHFTSKRSYITVKSVVREERLDIVDAGDLERLDAADGIAGFATLRARGLANASISEGFSFACDGCCFRDV